MEKRACGQAPLPPQGGGLIKWPRSALAALFGVKVVGRDAGRSWRRADGKEIVAGGRDACVASLWLVFLGGEGGNVFNHLYNQSLS